MKALIALVLVAPLSVFAAGSNDLIVVPALTKGAAAISIDFVSSGDAAGVSFVVDVGNVSEKQVNLSACTSSLPKGRSGSCGFKNGQVFGVVYSPNGTAIPAGIINVGRISVSGTSAQPKVTMVEAFDVAGNPLPGVAVGAEK